MCCLPRCNTEKTSQKFSYLSYLTEYFFIIIFDASLQDCTDSLAMDSADTIALFANDACSEPTQYVTIARRIINEATALEQEKHWDKVHILFKI